MKTKPNLNLKWIPGSHQNIPDAKEPQKVCLDATHK